MSLLNKRITIFLPILLAAIQLWSNNEPDASEINLQGKDFNTHTASIQGKLNFYWQKFYTADQINQKQTEAPNTINTFYSWENQPQNIEKYPRIGFATYHFKIKINDEFIGESFIIRPDHFISYASEIYINNKKVAFNGSVGTSKEDKNYQASRSTHCIPFIADSNVIDVIIWVSNFDHFRGGIFRDIEFGLAQKMMQKREVDLLFDLLIIISLLIMFFYHFVWYFANTKDNVALFFSFTCLIFAIDFSLQDSMTFFLFFPNVSFNFSSMLHLSMPYFLPSSFIFFLHALFPNESSKIIRNGTGLITLILVSATFILGSSATSILSKPHFLYVGVMIVYVYYVVIKAFKNKRAGSTLFLWGYILFSLCAVNDILFVFEVFQTPSLVSTGLIVFVFLLSIMQGNRMVAISNRNKKLSESLLTLNTTLEEKVEKRTAELNNTVAELKKLSSFKEDMTNMLVHDLKSPLSAIINIDKFSKSRNVFKVIKQTGLNMLGLVQNVLDVYKFENSELKLSKNEFALKTAISKAIKDVEYSAEQKSLAIVSAESLNCTVNADFNLITRVISNILSNAVTYSPVNGLIRISTESLDQGKVRIGISNDGPAIPESKQSIIFEKFGTVEESYEQTSNSTGIGLAFCKLAIEAHDGKIGVNSGKETGVEFWFTLPNSKCSGCLNCQNQSDIFSNKESLSTIESLGTYIDQLRTLKVFEITAINSIIQKIPQENISVIAWVNKLEQIVYRGDQAEYDKYLNPE